MSDPDTARSHHVFEMSRPELMKMRMKRLHTIWNKHPKDRKKFFVG